MKRIMILLGALALLVVAIPLASASAGVERHQEVSYTINVATVNGNAAYWHEFHVDYDPCAGTYTGTGTLGAGSETLSAITLEGDTLSARSDYDFNTYNWFPSFVLEGDGTLTFVDGHGSDNVTAATGTWVMTSSDYKNHGDYVSQNTDSNPDAAHSCIGMPVNSKKNK